VLFDGPPADPPEWLATLPRPAAYVTLGTVPVFSTSGLLRTIIDGLDPVVASIVVTTGPNPVAELGELRASVHAVPYLPQSLVLPHVDLMVSQAGAGGSVGALLYALPHLALPQTAQSQISVADRIHDLGVGLTLAAAEQGTDAIGASARELLGDDAYARRAAELAAELEQLPSPTAVLQIVATQRASPS
jgi:UDP:flavonoid glycosyltransferase YjiC (YdhE family)